LSLHRDTRAQVLRRSATCTTASTNATSAPTAAPSSSGAAASACSPAPRPRSTRRTPSYRRSASAG
jgi:hypothetical protein